MASQVSTQLMVAGYLRLTESSSAVQADHPSSPASAAALMASERTVGSRKMTVRMVLFLIHWHFFMCPFSFF